MAFAHRQDCKTGWPEPQHRVLGHRAHSTSSKAALQDSGKKSDYVMMMRKGRSVLESKYVALGIPRSQSTPYLSNTSRRLRPSRAAPSAVVLPLPEPLDRESDDLVLDGAWDDDDAVEVGEDEFAGIDEHVAAPHRDVMGHHPAPCFARRTGRIQRHGRPGTSWR